jgi:hypothetical protein
VLGGQDGRLRSLSGRFLARPGPDLPRDGASDGLPSGSRHPARRPLTTWRRTAALLLAFLGGLAVQACGAGRGLAGEYEEESGVGSLDFQADGRVYVSFLGVTVAGEYELDGARVIVKGPNGSQVLTRNGERLEGGLGLTYVLKGAAR